MEFCTNYHCVGDCGKRGFGVQHALSEPDKSKDFNDFDAQDEREATERDEDEFGMGRGW